MMRGLLILVATSFTAITPSAPAAGRLLNTTGTWVRDNPADPGIRPGIIVYAGERFRLTSGTDASFAEFMLYSGRVKKCVKNSDCIIPDETPRFRSLWRRLIAKLEPPPLVAFAMARGSTLTDAVLPVQNGQLDLRAALESLDGARYRIVLQNLRRDEPPVEFEYEWQPRDPRPAAVAVGPGLFQLTVITPERAELGPAVVYIADAAAYPDARQSLQDAQSVIAAAAPPLSEMARRQLLLAVLHSQP